MNEMQRFLKQARCECLLTNPMSMEEIDRIIHEENYRQCEVIEHYEEIKTKIPEMEKAGRTDGGY